MKLIIKPFNGVFFMLISIITALTICLTLLLRNRSDKLKKMVLFALGTFNIILWIFYKIWLYMGVEELNVTGYVFDIFKELPLHLCNIALILFVIGLAINSEMMYSYCFYVAVIGAFMALVAPSPGFYETSLLSLHNIGYYGTHSLLIINGILLVTLKLFKPTYKGAIKGIFLLMVLAGLAHLVNLFILNVFNGHSDYFYTMHVYDISLLNALWNLIPVRFLYLLPGFCLGGLVMILITVPFELVNKKR